METLILPISGVLISNQFSIYSRLKSSGYHPDIIMCSSGGSIVTYLCLAVDDDEEFSKKLLEYASLLRSTHQVKDHPLAFQPFKWLFRYYGIPAFYIQGEPLPEVFHTFDFNNLPELWIATYSKTKKSHVLWTNKSKTLLEPRSNVLHERFSDSRKMDDITRASSCIPIYVSGINIDNEEYVDGGIGAIGSPLVFMLNNYNTKSFHMIYASPVDIRYIRKFPRPTIPQYMVYDFSIDFLGMCVEDDLLLGEAIIKRKTITSNSNLVGVKVMVTETDEGEVKDLDKLLKRHYQSENSFLILYLVDPVVINPLYFEEGDLRRNIEDANTHKMYYRQIWNMKYV